jgi:molybdenum cofactor synthesis domain-containing protein
MASACILIVGDEILSGEIRDENAPFLLRILAQGGVEVRRVVTAPDQRDAIVEEIRHLRALADAVVVSGGMGPTHDDVTRPAVAEALGVALETNPEAERRIRAWYREKVTPAELGMARMPCGAELLEGPETGTFGFCVAAVYVLPGVPFLFRDVAALLPPRFLGRPVHRRELRSDRREGEIAPDLARLQGECLDVAIGSYPVFEGGRWHVRVVLRATDPARLAEVEDALRALV